MAIKDKEGNWLDGRGRPVPPKYIPKIDKRRDYVVEKICKKALNLHNRMKALKKEFINDIENYIAFLEKEYNQTVETKGNLQLTGFSGDKQVLFSISDVIEFDERLSVAKAAIDECIKKWSTDAHKNLKVVVDQAFEVDKKGRINKMAILKLRTLKINDKDWKNAMQILTDSIRISSTREYLNIKVKQDGQLKTVNLNFSSI